MSDQVALLEKVLANTRQQLSNVMAANAELAAMLEVAQERLAAVETDAPIGDTEGATPAV